MTESAHTVDLQLRGDHITLDALLKAAGLAASGGDAKAPITSGQVWADGSVELRRGRKLRPGPGVAAGPPHVLVPRP